MLKKNLALLFCLFAVFLNAQTKINWETLRDVKYFEKYNEEIDAYVQVPTFGASVRALAGKEIEISGYVIPLDIPGGIYVLSANPFAACFFCGGGGPETVMDLKFVKAPRRYKTDERITFRGKLKLNTNDIYQMSYIMEAAKQVSN